MSKTKNCKEEIKYNRYDKKLALKSYQKDFSIIDKTQDNV